MHHLLRLLFAMALCAVLAPIASARPSWSGFYQATPQQASLPPGSLIRYEATRTPPFFRAKAWRILYATRDYLGRPILSSGLVVLPDYAARNPNDRTIVAWAHPTVGIARHCAPTLAKSPVATILGINELVSSGHIIAATDYPGLGTVGPIGYLVGRGQANAVVDAVRAARQIPEVGGGRRYGLWGYSQGGHAALFASQLSQRYAPELQLVGTATIAPPTGLAQLFKEDLATVEGRVLTSYALGSWAVKYNIPLGVMADEETLRTIRTLNAGCITDFAGMMDAYAAQKPLAARFLKADPLTTSPWSGIIAGNSIASLAPGSPALVLQGSDDTIVRPAVTRSFVSATCRARGSVQYSVLRGKGHGSSAKAGMKQAVAWLNDRFKGKRAQGSCN